MCRFKDYILFELKVIEEAVQNIDISFIDAIEKEFDKLPVQRAKESIKFLNLKFDKYDICFELSQSQSRGLTTPEGYIKIFLAGEEFLYNDELFKTIRTLVKHELIHRIQSSKMREKIVTSAAAKKAEEYYGNKQELMSYANQIVNDLLDEYNKKDLLIHLKKKAISDDMFKHSPFLKVYVDLFSYNVEKSAKQNYENRKTLEKLFKYMYQYLDNQDINNEI